MADKNRLAVRAFKSKRVRKKLIRDITIPRLTVKKSNKYIYASVVDDLNGKVLVSAAAKSPELKSLPGKSVDTARELGKLLAKRAGEKGLETVKFDRSGYVYHGRVKALAQGAREGGLKF